MMRVPEYDAELDLLAIAPGGRFAAYCLCSISQEENNRTGRNEGTTDPVATHPDFQRRGLAQALLRDGAEGHAQQRPECVAGAGQGEPCQADALPHHQHQAAERQRETGQAQGGEAPFQQHQGEDGAFEPVGFLDTYLTSTNYRVVPVVAFIRPGFTLFPDFSAI